MSEPLGEARAGLRDGASATHAGQDQALWIRAAWLLPLGVLVLVLTAPSEPLSWAMPWVPLLGVDLAFAIDGLSRLLLVLVAGVGVAVFFYAPDYLRGDARVGRLVLLLGGFFFAMAGAVLADDLVVLFVFWEATSVLSFLLVGFDYEKKARPAIAPSTRC